MEGRLSLPLWKKLTASVVTVTAVFVVLELIARLTVPPRDALIRQEHERVITVLGLPALNETMEFDPYLFWRLKKELRSVRVSGRIRDNEVDFVVNTYDSLRSPRLSPRHERLRLLALGDSSTFGLGVNDDETWPAQLQRLLDERGVGATVINAGVPGYTAFQGQRFLERMGLGLEPDLVIASFGFNDIDVWASRSDMETARLLALRRWEGLLVHSRFYDGLKSWLEGSRWGRVGVAERNIPHDPTMRPRLSPEEFHGALWRIKQLCDRGNIPLIFLIWPYASQVARRDPGFVYYQGLTAHFCQSEAVPCLILADRFIREERPLFIDHIHANVHGCRLAAEVVLQSVNL